MGDESLLDSGALDVIADLLEQHCWVPKQDYLSSGFLSTDANAMRFLAHHNRFIITSDDGGRYVTGTVVW